MGGGVMDKVRDQITIALMIICTFLIILSTSMLGAISNLQCRLDRQDSIISNHEKRMSSYEKRTTDALDNWDSMRKTQLVLLDYLKLIK